MDPADERHIERFVRRPASMAEKQRRDVERLIERDPGARAYARFLRGFYERHDEEQSGSVDPRVRSFLRQLFGEDGRRSDLERQGRGGEAPSVTPVEPYKSDSSVRPTVLAADTALPAQGSATSGGATDRAESSRFSVLATLASSDDRVLVRVVGDQKTEQGRLYVLSEQAERRAHVIVSIPELGLDIAADEEGQATFDLSKGTPLEGDVPTGARAEPYRDAWAGVSAVVRRPLASGRLPPGGETVLTVPVRPGASEERPENRVLCRRKDGTLTVTAENRDTIENREAPSPTLLAAEGPGPEPLLLSLRAGRSPRREVTADGVLTVRLYA